MGLILSPVGAIVTAEHWLFPILGLTRYWASYRGATLNSAALGAWLAAIALILVLYFGAGIHQFFLLIPAWITATLVYIVLARASGAGSSCPRAAAEETALARRKMVERDYLAASLPIDDAGERSIPRRLAQAVGWGALGWTVIAAIRVATSRDTGYAEVFAQFQSTLVWTTGVYFVATMAAIAFVRRPGALSQTRQNWPDGSR